MAKKKIGRIGKIALVALVGSSLTGSFVSGYNYRDAVQNEVYPPLDLDEKEVLMKLDGNPQAIQEFIATGKFSYDERFIGSVCPNNAPFCEVWTPAAHYLRTKKGDCDDIMALVHYALNKSGKVLFLGGNPSNHVVYVYPGENGLYGVVSNGKLEYSPPKYKTLDEIAQTYAGQYSVYREITLPNEDDVLLYSFDIWDKIKVGPVEKIMIKKK
ncbi:MAG: hypothetical protein AABW48_02420 [Nanoarchaeota archaeon]